MENTLTLYQMRCLYEKKNKDTKKITFRSLKEIKQKLKKKKIDYLETQSFNNVTMIEIRGYIIYIDQEKNKIEFEIVNNSDVFDSGGKLKANKKI